MEAASASWEILVRISDGFVASTTISISPSTATSDAAYASHFTCSRSIPRERRKRTIIDMAQASTLIKIPNPAIPAAIEQQPA